MLKPMGDRVAELIIELGNGTFPTYSQLKIMLKLEGYSADEVDRWFAALAAGTLSGESGLDSTQFVNKDVYLVLDEVSRAPLAFWTEGQKRILPLDVTNSESWRAANQLRSTLRSDRIL